MGSGTSGSWSSGGGSRPQEVKGGSIQLVFAFFRDSGPTRKEGSKPSSNIWTDCGPEGSGDGSYNILAIEGRVSPRGAPGRMAATMGLNPRHGLARA